MYKYNYLRKLTHIGIGVFLTLSFVLFTNAGFVIQTNIASGIQYMKKIFVMASDGTTTGVILDGNGPSYFSGSVGIGTTSPNSKLSVFSTVDGQRVGRFLNDNNGTSTNASLQAVNASSNGSALDVGHRDRLATTWAFRAYGNVSRSENANVSDTGSIFLFGVRGDGNVGIGTTSPGAKLHINDSINGELNLIVSNSYGGGTNTYLTSTPTRSYLQSTSSLGFVTSYGGTRTENITIKNSNGYVGIKTSDPLANFHVYSTESPSQIYYGQMHLGGSIGINNDITLIMGTHRTSKYSYIQGWEGGIGSSKLSLNPNGGNVGVGNINPSYTLDVTGTGRFTKSVFAASFLYNSDRRLKKDITVINSALDKILALNGYSFVWKNSGASDIGVIAQEIEKQFPDLVLDDADGFKAVKYPNLIAPVIQAIKEFYSKYIVQEKKVNELEQTVKSLQATVQELKTQVDVLSQK